MAFKKVTAIVRTECVEKVEVGMHELNISGMSVVKGKGHGGYANFFSTSWDVEHAQVSVFVNDSQVKDVVETIMDVAHCGTSGDGIISVMPVDELYSIHAKAAVLPDEL
jgi:nitrogen regulatory protein P-II 1